MLTKINIIYTYITKLIHHRVISNNLSWNIVYLLDIHTSLLFMRKISFYKMLYLIRTISISFSSLTLVYLSSLSNIFIIHYLHVTLISIFVPNTNVCNDVNISSTILINISYKNHLNGVSLTENTHLLCFPILIILIGLKILMHPMNIAIYPISSVITYKTNLLLLLTLLMMLLHLLIGVRMVMNPKIIHLSLKMNYNFYSKANASLVENLILNATCTLILFCPPYVHLNISNFLRIESRFTKNLLVYIYKK